MTTTDGRERPGRRLAKRRSTSLPDVSAPPGPPDPTAPTATIIAGELRAAGVDGVALHLFDELPSTNRWLEARIPLAAERRALCAADLQSAGLARRGRSWVSVAGNVALSLLERLPAPPARLTGLSLVTGIAVAAVLRESGVSDVRIKWPNDIVVDGAKLGGLLATMQACPEPSATVPCTAVVSGIGLNVVHDERVAALGIGGTSLEALGVRLEARDKSGRDALLGRIAARVFVEHARFLATGWASFADEWAALDWLAGRDVDVLGTTGTERARAIGVNADGALRVRVGVVERLLYGGEVSVRPAS